METDIAMIATMYLGTRIGIVAALGYLLYQVVHREAARIPIEARRNVARERYISSRLHR